MEVKLTGTDKLTENIDKLMNGINNDLKKIITDGAVNIEADAKINCPVDTGRLRSSITHNIRLDLVGGWTGRVGTNVEYAPYVEFGTPRMIAAHGVHDPASPVSSWAALSARGGSGQYMPFLRSSLRKNKKHIDQLIKEALEK